MLVRLITTLLFSLNTQATELGPESAALDDLMSPDEIATELGITEPTDLSPQIEAFTPEQIFQTYGVDVYAEFPVVVAISKGSQSASVYHNGRRVSSFAVSTGRERWERARSGKVYFSSTPTGWFSPKRYIRDHWSSTWDARMEYSIFFNGGIALHATTPDHYKELGRRASGGCVRLHRNHAAWLWSLALSERTATVPYFTRGGQLLRNTDGSIKRRSGPGTLIIVTSY